MHKKILITGAGSYIGTSFENWLKRYGEKYAVDTVSTTNGEWETKDFTGYETVLHVAGIAHIKETKKNAHRYYEVNRDLAYEIAKKAKSQNVRQFIFLSTMAIYGMETGEIDGDTKPNPKTHYGRSKLEAEELLSQLSSDTFKIAIVRPPMVYGNGCKGNFPKLVKLARSTPIFPDYPNKRSMIFIDNLCECLRMLVDEGDGSIYHPQNSEYVSTPDMVKLIAECTGKRILTTKALNPLVRLLPRDAANKLFGDLYYDKAMSGDTARYSATGFKESIKRSI